MPIRAVAGNVSPVHSAYSLTRDLIRDYHPRTYILSPQELLQRLRRQCILLSRNYNCYAGIVSSRFTPDEGDLMVLGVRVDPAQVLIGSLAKRARRSTTCSWPSSRDTSISRSTVPIAPGTRSASACSTDLRHHWRSTCRSQGVGGLLTAERCNASCSPLFALSGNHVGVGVQSKPTRRPLV